LGYKSHNQLNRPRRRLLHRVVLRLRLRRRKRKGGEEKREGPSEEEIAAGLSSLFGG